MAVKVDLAKAYDRLEWSFIHHVLTAFHLPCMLIDLIMSCISSTSISILFNGGKLDSFKPTRGIRQGDPLSPYIFILCMEYLGYLINRECLEKRWVPMKASRDNVGISHLFFADDLMLFAKPNIKGAKSIKEVLQKFVLESGQAVSLEKSRVYFSPNVPESTKDNICETLGIQATLQLGKYLGFPLKHRETGRNQYNFVVDRLISKLAGWKSKLLSFAGRTVLVNSVMTAIPNYVMQGIALPTHLCSKIDKINRDFIWGSTEEKRRLHLVGWSKIIKAKEEGGLGIQAARSKNIAMLAKLNWRLYQEKDLLWAKVLLYKYCSWHRMEAKNSDSLPCSPTWKAIKVGFPIFEKGVYWSVGSQSPLNFWESKWVKGCSIREQIAGPLNLQDTSLSIAEVFHDGQWDWDKISFDLPCTIMDKIKATPIQLFGEKEDTLMWKFSKDGDFSMDSAYTLAGSVDSDDQAFTGSWVWQLDSLPKIIHFIWLGLHHSIPVRKIIAARGIQCSVACPICHTHEESILHLLRDCPFARDFWRKIGTP